MLSCPQKMSAILETRGRYLINFPVMHLFRRAFFSLLLPNYSTICNKKKIMWDQLRK